MFAGRFRGTLRPLGTIEPLEMYRPISREITIH